MVPASLIANWASEIDRFYPDLACHVAHPASTRGSQIPPPTFMSPERGDVTFQAPGSSGLRSTNARPTIWGNDDLSRYDLVITTYGMVQRYDLLQTFCWDYVILDEAQAIKKSGNKTNKDHQKITCN